jgi:hypothetical protein
MDHPGSTRSRTMKLIKRVMREAGKVEEIVLTESAYSDELRARGRRVAAQEGLRNPMWVYPRRPDGQPDSQQLLYADGRPTNYFICA